MSPRGVSTIATRLRSGEGKYHISPKEERTYNGRLYHSRAEARYAAQLDIKKRAGLIVDWRPQVRFPLSVHGEKVATLVVDFEITYRSGHVEYVEIKGWETDISKLKRKLFQVLYPEHKLLMVKA